MKIVFGILFVINVSIVVAVPDCTPENRGYSYPTPVVSSYINGWTSNLGIKDSAIDLPSSSIRSNTINTARVVQLPSAKYSETGVGGINEYENDGIKIYNTDTTGYNGVVAPGQNRFYSSVPDQEPFDKIITRKILTANVNTGGTSATTHVLQDINKLPSYSFSKPPSLNTANTTPLATYSTSAKFRSRDEVSHSLIPNTREFSKSNVYKSVEEIPSLSSVIYKPVITTSKKINYDIQPGIFYAPVHTDTASPTLGLVYSKITTPKKGLYGYDGSQISQSYGGHPLSVYDYDRSHISHSSSGDVLSNYKNNIALNKPTISTSFISPIKSKTLHPVTYNLNTMLKKSTAIPSSLVYLPPSTTYTSSYINPQPYFSKSRLINGQSTSSYQMNTYPSLTISTPSYGEATKNLYYSNRISVPLAQAAYSIPSTVITPKLNIQSSSLTTAVSPFVTQKSIDSKSNVPALYNDYPVYPNSLRYGLSAPASIATVNNPSYVNTAISVKTNEAPVSLINSLYHPNKITSPEVVSYTSGAQFSSLLSESNNYKIEEARRDDNLPLLSAENKVTTLSNSLLNGAQSHDYITRSGTLKKISKIPIIYTSHAGLSGSNAGFTYRDGVKTSFAGDSIRTLISNSPIHSTIISNTDSHPSKILLSSPSYTTYGTHRGSDLSQLSNLKLTSPSSTVSDYNAKLLVNKMQHSTINKSIGTRYIEYYDDHPRYAFEYGVNDPNTGDIKHQKEERDGDVVRGEYSLLEPDGNIRTVSYYADWETGFHTNITNSKDSGIQGITQSNIDK